MKRAAVDGDRARRFHIQAPLRYRTSGQSDWYWGKIENISWSGVLFQGEQLIELDTPIEISFVLPATVREETRVIVLCSGKVVRNLEPLSTEELPTLGARILDYRFVRQSSGRALKEA